MPLPSMTLTAVYSNHAARHFASLQYLIWGKHSLYPTYIDNATCKQQREIYSKIRRFPRSKMKNS